MCVNILIINNYCLFKIFFCLNQIAGFKIAKSRTKPCIFVVFIGIKDIQKAIQGIIIEDRPGYKPIYIQTRKLEPGSIITSWSMQTFGDAVERKAGRGLLVTNANFSKPAQDYAKQKHIILIDGRILARLMIVNNFCVNVKEVVEVKSIDPNVFSRYKI